MSADPLPELRSLVLAKAAAPTRAARRASGQVGPRRTSAAAARREQVYARTLSLIGEGYAQAELSLADVAGEIGIPARTLQHNLAAHGQGFGELLRAIRIARAAELVLAAPAQRAVAERVGYRHENHFARAFERQLGVSPSVLGKALRARDRHERIRAQLPRESARSQNALEAQIDEDAVLVGHVHRQLAAA